MIWILFFKYILFSDTQTLGEMILSCVKDSIFFKGHDKTVKLAGLFLSYLIQQQLKFDFAFVCKSYILIQPHCKKRSDKANFVYSLKVF